MGANNRRHLARTCKKFGLLVQPKAVPALMREMDVRGDRFPDLLEILKERVAQNTGPKLVSPQLVESVLEEEQQKEQYLLQKANKRKKKKIVLHNETENETPKNNEGVAEIKKEIPEMFHAQSKSKSISTPKPNTMMHSAPSQSSDNKSWKVISAFDMPKLVYDSMGRQFHYEYSRKSLMGTAKDLMDMRIQRYELVKQKVDRYREQRRLSPLTTIDRLLGASTSKNTNFERTLLGMLRSNPALGCLELEDSTGSIPLRIDTHSSTSLFSSNDATKIDTNGVYLEGSIVLVRGNHEESELFSNAEDSSGTVFRCTSIELPLPENKAETRSNLPPSPYADDFPDFRKSSLQNPVPIYTLSNLCLDEELCLERVGAIIDRMIYETSGNSQENDDGDGNNSDYNSGVGAILVLFGNFCTESSTTSAALDELARLLQDKNIPSKHSILLVPGPMDVGSNACWPLPAWTKRNTPASLHPLLASEMGGGNVHLCTNPCRLEFSDGRQVLLMRKNLMKESLQHQVLNNPNGAPRPSDSQQALPPLVSRVLYHTMSQCHLSPSSSSQQAASTSCSPIYWNYDHAMAMYPLPDLMILGLDAEFLGDGTHFGRAGCRIVSPISNPSQNEWQCCITTLGKKQGKIYVEFDNGDDEEEEELSEEMEQLDDDEEMGATEPTQTEPTQTEPTQTEEEIHEKYHALVGTQDTQFSQTQLSVF